MIEFRNNSIVIENKLIPFSDIRKLEDGPMQEFLFSLTQLSFNDGAESYKLLGEEPYLIN